MTGSCRLFGLADEPFWIEFASIVDSQIEEPFQLSRIDAVIVFRFEFVARNR